MPPIKRFEKEDIVNTAYEIVKKEGFSGLNARRIAKELRCSVQPIFHNFETMEELEEVVKKKIYDKFDEKIRNASDKEKPYLAKGMAYIRFAKDYPEFFKILFMKKSDLSPKDFILNDKATTDTVLEAGQAVFNLSSEEQNEIHVKSWIFTHGIACLVATATIEYSEEELKDLLGSAVRQLIYGYKNNIR